MRLRRTRAFLFDALLVGALGLIIVLAVLGGTRASQQLGPVGVDSSAGAPRDELEEAKRYDAPAEANDFYLQKRSPDGESTIAWSRYREALEHARAMPRYSTRSGRTMAPLASVPQVTEKGEAGGSSVVTPAVAADLGTWTPAGPGNIGGRTRALLIHPGYNGTTNRIMYAGAASGGVWRSVNGGGSWVPLADFMANITVNALAFEPGNPSVIYAGTGEAYFFTGRGQRDNGGQAVSGAGIFKSTDSGATWTAIGGTDASVDFHFVNDIVVSTSSSQRVYVTTRTGVHRSLNGGATWAKVLNAPVSTGCFDLAIRTDLTADTVFATCGNQQQGTIYRNTDAGGAGTWDVVLNEANMGRTSLAIAPSQQATIYALSASNAAGNYLNGLHAVFRSTTGGGVGTWTPQVRNTDPTLLNTLLLSNTQAAIGASCYTGGTNEWVNQGWYDNVIAVDPLDPARVWVGGVDLMRSDNAGEDWGIASRWYVAGGLWTQYAHADQHAIVFHPQYNGTTNRIMWVGNDGGVFTTNDARAAVATDSTAPCNNAGGFTWTPLNTSYAVTQFYDGTAYPNGTTYFGGTQDNGTVRGTDAGGLNGWTEILGGDGGYVAVKGSSPQTIYAENFGLSIQKSIDGGTNWDDAVNGISPGGFNPSDTVKCNQECFLFIVPFVMDPTNDERLWTGGWYLWRTGDGAANWQKASAVTAGGRNTRISAIAVAPTDSNYVLAGMNEGYIHRTTIGLTSTGTTAWPVVQPRTGYVSSVAFDPTNKTIAYATYSTFGGTHVWKSTDSGATWNDSDGAGATGLPDIPVHSIVVDPANTQRLYVGTDLGVFVSLDGGGTWAVENSGFPNVVTERLKLNTVDATTTLWAFTFGRGAFRVPLALVERPANDLFANAQALTGSGTVNATNRGAMKQSGERNHAGNPGGASIWYSFTPAQSGELSLTTAGSSFDTLLAVYTGSSLSALQLVAENDDVGGGPLTSSVGPFDVTGGTTYRIAVDGFFRTTTGPQTGAVALNVTFTPDVTSPGPPTNVSASPRNGAAQVSWAAPASTGGSPITGYTITPYDGATALAPTVVGNVLTALVGGLTNGTAYTFKVKATNVAGTGPESAASDPVTPPGRSPAMDFDADGASDPAVFRSGVTYIHEQPAVPFGVATDVPVIADWDGDADMDVAIFRNGVWWIHGQPAPIFFGTSGDVPVPGDYDGDGDAEAAIFRNGVWWIDGQAAPIFYGTSGDVPVPGDYDGDGDVEPAVFRNGVWWISSRAEPVFFGVGADVPVVGDYDGDGDGEPAIFRDGVWWISSRPDPVFFGVGTDVPAPGDYDGDGDDEAAVFRDGVWWLASQPGPVFFGIAGDIALALPAAIRMTYYP